MSSIEKIQFPSGGGLRCAADLYLPAAQPRGEKCPGLVIGHGFSIVRSMLREQARMFCEAGYVVLAIDYRSFGESEGEPRGQLFPLQEAEDFRNAISWLQRHPAVDPERIGIWGTSFGGAMVSYVAAVDRRVKATVAQVPVTDGYIWMKLLRSEQHFVELLDAVDRDREQRLAGKPGATIRAAGAHGEVCGIPSTEDVLKFFDDVKREHPSWSNAILLESIEKILQFSPLSMVERIAPRPYLIVACGGYDVVHPAWAVADLYERARQPKELVFLPYDQTGLYYEPGLGESVRVALGFFDRHLRK